MYIYIYIHKSIYKIKTLLKRMKHVGKYKVFNGPQRATSPSHTHCNLQPLWRPKCLKTDQEYTSKKR